MKINDLTSTQQAGADKIGKSQEKSFSSSFADILQKELQAIPQSDATGTSPAVSPTTGVSAALRLDSLMTSERTIDTLEKFSEALTNRAYSANDLEPFAAELENDTAALLALKNKLPNEDPLSSLLDRVATVSYLEAAKFRRGDYNA